MDISLVVIHSMDTILPYPNTSSSLVVLPQSRNTAGFEDVREHDLWHFQFRKCAFSPWHPFSGLNAAGFVVHRV